MKKFIFYILLILTPILTNGQITLEHTVYPWNRYEFYPVKISLNETKYVVIDTTSNTFDLLNLDYTTFLSNIQLPASLNTYQIMYVTRTLFDCDSSNIEFVYEDPNYYAATFYILRTDGTILFQKDSARAPYCIGCLGGSQDTRPIFNTENGAKLQLFSGTYPYRTLEIYSLCGFLIQDVFELSSNLSLDVNVYPNPSIGKLFFEVNWQTNDSELLLLFVDSSGKELKKHKLNSQKRIHEIDINDFSTGSYFYKLTDNNQNSKSGKIIIVK